MKEAKTKSGGTGGARRGQSVARGALILAACGFVGKLLGAVYRISLTGMLGAEGMGLYQLIFPVYSLLLTVSSGGIPSAVSRLVSERIAVGKPAEGRRIARNATVSLLLVGLVCAGVTAALSGVLARAQGNPLAAPSYIAVAPAVALVAVISALRGYFQGRRNMTPSALSQLAEQAVKLAAGLALASVLGRYGVQWAACGATLGVACAEAVALLLLVVLRAAERDPLPVSDAHAFGADCRALWALAVPITLGGIVMPLTQLIDSAMVVNILSRAYTTAQATALYGIASGTVGSLVNMPVVLTLAVATATLPNVAASHAVGDRAAVREKSGLALRTGLLLTLPCAAALALFARPITDLLYGGGLTVGAIDEPSVAASLLVAMSTAVPLLGTIQIATGLLHAVGRVYAPVVNLAVGAALKLALNFLLLPVLGVYAVALSTVTCYGVACIGDLTVLAFRVGPRVPLWRGVCVPVLATALTAALGSGVDTLLVRVLDARIAVVVALLVCGAAYCLFSVTLGAFDERECDRIPVIGRFLRVRARRRRGEKNGNRV